MTRIAILGRTDTWHVRDLLRAANEVRVPAECIEFESLSAATGGGIEHRRLAEKYDAVVVRSMPRGSLEQVIFRMDVLGQLAARGVYVCNPPRSLEIAIDKYLTLARLDAAGVPTPRSIVTQRAEDALQAFDTLGGDVVVKPLFGGEGRGIMRIEERELAGRAFRTLEQLQAVIYIQEFVAHPGFDIRVLVIGERSVAMRRFGEGDWRTNLGRGGRAESVDVPRDLELLARRAAEAVGAAVAGVDILTALDGTPYVLEVNAVPGWRGLTRASGVDVAASIVKHVMDSAGDVAIR